MRSINTLEDARVVIQQLMDKVDRLENNDLNFHQRRITNAHPSVNDYDYVVKKEVSEFFELNESALSNFIFSIARKIGNILDSIVEGNTIGHYLVHVFKNHIKFGGNNLYDIGTSAVRGKKIYFTDMELNGALTTNTDLSGDIGTSTKRFTKAYLNNLRLDALTASRPLKLNGSKDAATSVIDGSNSNDFSAPGSNGDFMVNSSGVLGSRTSGATGSVVVVTGVNFVAETVTTVTITYSNGLITSVA